MALANNSPQAPVDFHQDEVFNLRDLLNKYVYHWPVFVLSVFLFLTAGYLYLRYTQPIYMVTSSLLIKEKDRSASSDVLSKLDPSKGSKSLDNEIEILKSRTLMRQVVDRLHLNVTYKNVGKIVNTDAYETRPVVIIPSKLDSNYYGHDFNLTFVDNAHYQLEDVISHKKVTGPLDTLHQTPFGVYRIDKINPSINLSKEQLKVTIFKPNDVVTGVLGGLSVENVNKRSTIIQLSYVTPSVKLGEDILNTLAQVYNEAAFEDKNQTVKNTLAFINKKLEPITGELTSVEKQVEQFKSSQGIIDMSAQGDLYLGNVKSNDLKLADVNIKLAVIDDINQYVNANANREKIPSTMGIEDPQLAAQIAQLADLQTQKQQLLATTPAANPIFEPLNQQIATLRKNIQGNVKNIAVVLQRTKNQIVGGNNIAQGAIKKIPGQEREFISIKRQQVAKESLYNFLLQKREETELSFASTVPDSRLIDPAIGTGGPIKPKKQIVMLVAFLIALILPVTYIHAKDLLKNKVYSKADLNSLTKAPLLGELSFEEGTDAIVVSSDSRRVIAEQFRALRTNLQFIQGKSVPGAGRVTLFTSSISGEGKSFVASNLGVTFALSGRRTIILELDLRKPKIIKYLKLSSKLGLSNYFIGKASYEDILQESGVHPKLFVMGSGPIPPNPSELLMQIEMDDLIGHLRKDFDEIIIDAPPVGLVTDAQILAPLADATLYVVRHGVTLKADIQQFDALYKQDKFPKLNLILNGVQVGGKYGYGYGYGYYGEDAESNKFSIKRSLKGFFKRF
ncbi:polysaccharide biosynthesis tyrosine autokinase [Pedobacter changchengzhani]|uniref:Polysaccharide biosynthesis tyrosine autokinase n=1 Tax=Pedobacter changchengzhani TaxID=2529274 RepID=A0A4R5MQK8_9SPHI|nr:tyrosine-protein kinase [Pedobacter changchengzhani]TDG37695.1 polysaccharide biosynthesis tyrosine autokinase [Pedobacter changchengzhani]